MKKGQKHRRVFARQVAAEVPENGLTRIGGANEELAFSTCDGGTLTHDPRSGRDCTGTPDDIGFPPV